MATDEYFGYQVHIFVQAIAQDANVQSITLGFWVYPNTTLDEIFALAEDRLDHLVGRRYSRGRSVGVAEDYVLAIQSTLGLSE